MRQIENFRVGDKVKLIKNDRRYHSWVGDTGEVSSVRGDYGPETLRVYTKGVYRDWHKEYTKLVTDKGENMSRRTFRLIKDAPEIKKGILVQENCDEGNQEYVTLNMDKFMRFDDWTKYFSSPSNSFSRDTVEQNPEWFEEVFPATEQWLTKEERDNLAKFLGGQTTKAPVGPANSAASGPYSFLYTMAVGDKKTVKNADVKKTAAAIWYAQKKTGNIYERQRANDTHTYFIRVK